MLKRLILLLILISGILQASQLLHTRYESIIKGQPLLFNLELRDIVLPSVDSVELFYKGDVDGGYTKVNMTATALGAYLSNITPILNDAAQFQYYFSVRMSDGTTLTLPEIFPEENAFIADVKKSESDPGVRLLNPINKGIISDPQPVFLISFEDPYNILDLNTIALKIDGLDVSRDAQIVNHFVSYIPATPLSEANHTIEFHVLDKNGQTHTILSSFLYQAKQPSLVEWKGNESVLIDLYGSDVSPNTRTGSRMRNILEMNMKSGFVNADIYDYRTSEESAALQRQNRTRLVLYDDNNWVRIFLKDQSPVYSYYGLNGVNIDGAGVQFNWPNVLQANMVQGETARALLGDSNPSENRNGTFTQKVFAWQVASKTGGWDNSLSYVSFKDDKDSLPLTSNWGTSLPQENRVLDWQSKLSLSEDQSSYLKSELAGSVFYPDISTGEITTVPTEAKKAIPEFILNSVPIRAGMSAGAAGLIEYQTPFIFKELLIKPYGNFALPGFKSLGNTSVKTDDLAGGAQVKLNLLRGAMSFSGAYQKNRDNLLQSSLGGYITYGDDYKANINMDVFGLAYFGYNYNFNSKLNDATENVALIDNQTRTDLFSFNNIRLDWDKFRGMLNTNYSVINYNDAVSNQNNFTQTGLGFAVDTEFTPIKAKFSFSNANKEAKGNTPNTTVYSGYSVRLDYEYIPKILSTYGSIALQMGLNNGNDLDARLDTNKTTLGLGLLYRYPSKVGIFVDTKMYVDVAITAVSDRLAAASDKSKNYSEQTLLFKLTTTF